MSEPKLISPMLDNFDMGGPISNHNGVRCCPAMRKNSDDKYIVKIISVPESQTKLDALLLTGAFSDNQSALSYFEELANGIVDEKKILDNLSQLEGFLSFEDCQIIPMEDAVGYDVYLLSEYRRTLERQNAKTPMTQLSAVNLGLDLCAALSVCRRSGYLLVDLKPSNIYVIGGKEYKIGDLGFVRLNSLKYESLPNKYRSCYTAPELEDVFAPLNETMDIYSVGLILYQVFNGGRLPFEGQQAPIQEFDAPEFADAEMAEIILKACHPNPAERWQDPVEMGQAIVSYMQKNGVNDTPLTSEFFGRRVDADASSEESESPVLADEEEVDLTQVEDSLPSDLEETQQTPAPGDIPVAVSEVEEQTEDTPENTPEVTAAVVEVDPAEVISEPEVADAVEEIPVECDHPVQDIELTKPSTEAQDEYENLSFLDNLEEAEQILADVVDDYEGISDDISDILDQIDELTSHEVPSPVIAPDPVEIRMPDPIPAEDAASEEDTTEDKPGESTDETALNEDSKLPDETDAVEEVPEEEMPYIPKKKRTGLIWGIVIALLIALCAGGYYFYANYYLQPIHDLTLSGSEDSLQVLLASDIDESLLSVTCADSHGSKVSAPVVGGKAAFSGLSADTAYTVTVEIEGFHKLTGTTSKVYSTPVQTKISQIRAITGSESGSVIINFTVEGPDSDQWNVIYNADGEAERVSSFTDHMVTLNGLTVGKEYTFRLEPVSDIYVSGETEITHTAKNLICAENLHIVSFADGVLTAQWDLPDEESVAQWSVRCYDGANYNETVATDENTVTFENLDENSAYTVEVTAAEMSVHRSVSVAANAVTVSDFAVSSTPEMLSLSWISNREIPEEGWTIHYSVDGISAAEPLTVTENAAQIPAVPNGDYNFEIIGNAGDAVLGGPFAYKHSEASDFDAYNVSKSEITARLCKTSADSDWSYQDLDDEDYVNTFISGEKVSVVLACDAEAEDSSDDIVITYAVYNEDDTLVSFSHGTQNWNEMWDENYCELDIPTVPVDAGMYNVIIYFNGAEAGSQKFEITV